MKMSSRDDETLPLSGVSEGFSADVTVDEDFIPTSQPRSSPSSKASKSVESNLSESSEEVKVQSLSGFVDDTLPPEALIQETQDKSIDFIPDTDTKKRKIYPDIITCRKKLPVFDKEDIFGSLWGKHKVPENSAAKLQGNSIFCDSPVKMESSTGKIAEPPVNEVIINDSADTVELGDSPVKVPKLRNVKKLETHKSFSPDRCEETQVFDNSALMLDQPGPSCINEVNSQKLYLNETVDDELQLEDRRLEVSRDQVMEDEKQSEEALAKELSEDVTPQEASDSPPLIIKKVEFKLNISCLLTVNTATKKIIRKAILNVDDRPKIKTPPFYSEFLIDSTSDKSKRCSTSSSGSVYSDKNGLPFALPKKIPAVLDQNCTSDSSEDGWAKLVNSEIRNRERVPWCNECLLPLKMDEIVKGMMDYQDLVNRPITQSPKKLRRRIRQTDINLMDHISENSLSVQSYKSETDFQSDKILEGDSSDAAKCSTPISLLEDTPREETVEEIVQNDPTDPIESVGSEIGQEKQINIEPEKSEIVGLCDGLRVFARWTDKQYYSGVLSGQSKNDKWDVLFDDGTLKAIKEDFIMPASWLKIGSLVFALVDDNYESGQVTDIKKSDTITYVVQLDNEEQELTIGLPEMSLSDDMASLLRESYRPLVVESPQRKADINCDNVLSGKRLRENRTPLRPPLVTRTESSGSKKKPTSKAKDLETIKETPRKRKSDRKAGGKSESGNLNKSSDSQSGTEAGETPFRNTAKEARGKAKPRSLTYELEERLKKKQKNLFLSDNAAIPGPSGVKFRKRIAHEFATNILLESSLERSVLGTPEKGRRKRRAAEPGKDESPKKSATETEIRTTRGRKK